MQKADSWGRPWYALIPTLLVGGALAYINVDHTGSEVFGWLSSLTSLLTLFGWGMISLANIRMRAAWAAQGRSFADLPWKSWTWPWGAYWAVGWCVILLIAEFYLAVWPLGDVTSAENFFSVYISIVAVFLIYVVSKVTYFRGRRWVDISTIDLDQGRRFYKDADIAAATEKNGNVVTRVLKGIIS